MQSLQLSEGGGQYRLLVELGAGGMAEVFLAFVERGGLSKLQVVKRLKADLAHDPEFVRMFLDEARLGARLNHPNVVQTHEVGEHEGGHFIVMEYLEGQPLSRLRAQHQRKMGKPLPIEMHLRILSEVLRALEYAHNLADFDGSPLHVVHRDVSPQNIFITYDGVVKLVDFGVAKAAMNSVETRTGVMKGKLTYMAPEQVRASEALDRRADIFSVGAMLHEAITGERLWRGVPDVTVMACLLEGRIPRLPETAPPLLLAACERAMDIAPNRRHPTAGLFNLALEEAMRDQPPVTQEDLSALVRGLFHEERSHAQATIDAQLKTARTLSKEENASRPSLGPRATSSSQFPAVGALPPPRIADAEALVTPHVEAKPVVLSTSARPPHSLSPEREGGRRRSAVPLFIGLGVAALAAAALFVSMQKKAPESVATESSLPPREIETGVPEQGLQANAKPQVAKVDSASALAEKPVDVSAKTTDPRITARPSTSSTTAQSSERPSEHLPPEPRATKVRGEKTKTDDKPAATALPENEIRLER